jgi:hypothetical protein
VLPRGGPSGGAFIAALEEDLATIAAFRRRHGTHVVVDTIEARFPAELLAGPGSATSAFLDRVATLLDAGPPPTPACFFEAGFGAGWERSLPVLIDALGVRARAGHAGGRGAGRAPRREAGVVGFKLRCGGTTPDAFPSTEEVAFVVAHCRDHGVPIKCTAGLHHPLRHFNEVQRVPMHGFLNVFTAGVMAWAQKLEAPRIRQILEDGSPAGFAFGEDRFSWKGYAVAVDELVTLRARAMTSFGSCSFDEPRDDLRALGLLSTDPGAAERGARRADRSND